MPNRRQVLAGAVASAAILAIARHNGALAALSDEQYATLSVGDAVGEIRAGRTSVSDYVESLLARSDRLSHLNAFITQDKAVVRAAAAAADAKLAGGEDLGALSGAPFCAKDNIDSADMRTTGGTPGLSDWQPTTNAPVLQSLLDQDGVLIGKTNMHELAFGITNNNAGFGAAGNPYDAG
ncbi:MAG: amidase family protein, partial [Alphaproteobacteria bacterium]|nr:amidase family protein [Alphaproteobacteria bacterium]